MNNKFIDEMEDLLLELEEQTQLIQSMNGFSGISTTYKRKSN